MSTAVADGRVMAGRYLRHAVRAPAEIVVYFSLPIMFVLVFGYVFGSGMSVPGGGGYREFLIPGVFVMTMLYGIGATATALRDLFGDPLTAAFPADSAGEPSDPADRAPTARHHRRTTRPAGPVRS